MQKRWTFCPGRRVLLGLLLVVASLAGAEPVCAEEKPVFLAGLRVGSLDWLVDSILAMPEIACLEREVPGGLRSLIPAEALSRLAEMPETLVWARLQGNGRARWLIRRGGDLPQPLPDRGGLFGLVETLLRSDVSGQQGREATEAEPFPAIPEGVGNGEIVGWLEPKAVARLLTEALRAETGRAASLGLARCRRNERRIGRLLDKEPALAAKAKAGQPVTLASMPVCPFGGRYLLDHLEGSGKTQTHQIRCDHMPPAEPPLVPDTPIGKALGIALEDLSALPVLTLRFSASAGTLRIELPAVSAKPGYALPPTPWEPDYASLLTWVPAERARLPLSKGFPGGLFLGIDSRRLYDSMGGPAEALDSLEVRPGLVLLGGADPALGEPMRGDMPSPVIGIAAAADRLIPAIASAGVMLIGSQLTEELEGVDVPVWPLRDGSSMRGGEKPALHVLERDGMTYLSFERRFVRELLRSWNGESSRIVLPELRGEVKFALAVRMDVFGHLAAGFAREAAFRNEARRCGEGMRMWLASHDAESAAGQELLFGQTGEIPQDLQGICPAKGIMWHPARKHVMCAVHEGGWGALRRNQPPVPPDLIPTDRWLYVTLCRYDGKAVLEARIVTGTEVAK
ncbi:MAG TPA: hypothetical protein VIV61_08835 [Candidatus Ozemobacteraceae bacterium]